MISCMTLVIVVVAMTSQMIPIKILTIVESDHDVMVSEMLSFSNCCVWLHCNDQSFTSDNQSRYSSSPHAFAEHGNESIVRKG